MPTTIENNVVSMSFDNADFERNAKTTMGTLDKLKKSLDFSGTADSLNEVSNAASRVDMSGLQNGVEEVHNRFSALEVVAFTVLNRITNAAIDAGVKIGRALTIEGMVDGFQEYELTMNSIMTLMNGTGESLERVMAGLNDLNSYADQTIYSFSDMTANITKFTNQGVSLDDSVASMKGIANWAAYAGVGTQQAAMAMYNLGQALGRGYVQLIDWRSIMNAGMDTKAFKEQALEVAKQVGTVTDAMIQNYGVQGMFSDALGKENWLTNDVLITTLKMFTDTNTEIGKKATEAATQIKTFSQLMATIKESIGTGWAETWTFIFGDLDQAKALWTPIGNYISGIIGKMSDARNAIFKGWNLSGGRDNVIAGLADIATTLLDTFGSLSGAFQDVFGGLDAVKLDQFSIAFRNFASTLKEDIAPILPGIRNTFGGLFAIVDIGVTVVTSLARAFWYLLKNSGLADLAASLFGITGSFGEYIKNVDKTIKRNDTLYKAFKRVADFLLLIPKGINAAFTALTGMGVTDALNKAADALSNFFSTLGSGSSKVKEILDLMGANLAEKIDHLKNKMSGLGKETGVLEIIFTGFANGLKALGKAIMEVMSAIGGALVDTFGQTDVSNFMDFINTAGLAGSLGAFLLQLKNMMDPLDDINQMITNIREDLTILQNSLKADVIMKIAISVAILAGACLLIASIDPDKLGAPLGVITLFIAEISTAFAILDKFTSSDFVSGKWFSGFKNWGIAFRDILSSWQQSMKATLLVKLATSILVLAIALKVIASIDHDKLVGAMVSITFLLGELTAAAIALSKWGGKVSTSGLFGFAISLVIMANALKTISAIDPERLGTSVQVLTGFVVGLVFALGNLAEIKTETIAKMSGTMIALSVSMVILAKALSMLSNINPDTAVQACGMLAVAMGGMVAALNKMPSGSDVLKQGAGLLLMSAAMILMAKTIEMLSQIDGTTMIVAVGGLTVSLGAVVYAMKYISDNMNEKEMTFAAGALATAVGSLIVIGMTLQQLSQITPDQMIVSVGALCVTLYALSLALNSMKTAVTGAQALIIASAAIAILSVSLAMLSKIPFDTLVGSLALIVVAIMAFAYGSQMLITFFPAMEMFAAILLQLGAACMLVGAGFFLLGAGLTSLAVSGVAGATAFVGILSVIMGAIPMIVNAITLFVQTLLQSYITLMPLFVQTAIVTITAICQALITCVPMIINTVMTIILALLTAIRDNIQQIVEIGADIVINLINGISEKLPELIDAMFNLVIALIDGLGLAIENNAEAIRTAMIGFCEHLWNAFCNFFGIHSPSTKMQEGGNFLIDGLINGIGDKIEAVKAKLNELRTAMLNKLRERVTDFATRGREMMNKLKDGAEGVRNTLKSKMSSIASSMKDKLREKYSEFSKAGSYLMQGLIDGVGSLASAVANKASEIGKSVLASLKASLEEQSPSKATTEMGQFLDQGLINGMQNLREKTVNAAVRVANSVMTALTENLPDLEDEIDGEFNFTPVVKPMIDLTGIQNGVSHISDLFTDDTLDTILSVKDSRESRKESSDSSKSEGKTVINNVEINQRNESPNPMNTYEMYRNNKKLVEMIEGATS